jgi:NitT/TauT family transport system ATP-binding protein
MRTERDSEAPAIQLRDLTKVYQDPQDGTEVTALDRINLTIKPGEFISLIGPSGCGKTTLLKIVDGLIPFEGGEALVDGKAVTGPGRERAVVFQSFALLPWRTVEDNIAFGLELRGIPRKDAQPTIDEFVAMVGLKGFEKRYPGQLSGGMQQRVGLARALAVNPRILLMDEPFGALDAQTRNLLQADLERIWEADHKTVIFVTHAMDEAVFLSDRVVILSPRPGRLHEIVDVDLPRPRGDEIRKHPRFVELTSYIWDALRGMIVREPEDVR